MNTMKRDKQKTYTKEEVKKILYFAIATFEMVSYKTPLEEGEDNIFDRFGRVNVSVQDIIQNIDEIIDRNQDKEVDNMPMFILAMMAKDSEMSMEKLKEAIDNIEDKLK